jgi:uncharacterized protein (TIGR03790 family)
MNRFYFLFIAACLLLPPPACPLEPEEVLVIANSRVASGVELARYYMERRGIPADNLLLLDTPSAEACSRAVYDRQVAAPVRDRLARIRPAWRIRCLVTLYGLPLKIKSPSQSLAARESPAHKALLAELVGLGRQLPGAADNEEKSRLERRIRDLKNYIQVFEKYDGRASVDSELALVRVSGYPLSGWLHNPFYRGHRYVPPMVTKEDVLITARLDGPDPATVRRIIDDALVAEARGLRGVAYFDARYPYPEDDVLDGYQYYDRSIHQAAQVVRVTERLPVKLNDTSRLFQKGEAPRAALYCGWYSLGQYVDAFQWQPGAIAYHIASTECATLRRRGSRIWCKKLLEKGVAATIGPVNEPFVQAFPMPERFFLALTDGYLTLGECYLLSLPYLSWKMVLVGDPLYRPFKKFIEAPQ